MKKTIFTLLLLSLSLVTKASEQNINAILTATKWKLDFDTSFNINNKDFETKPNDYSKNIFNGFGIYFEFFKDEKVKIYLNEINIYEGNFALKKRNNNLSFIRNNKKITYQIVSLSINEIVLKSQDNNLKLKLIPSTVVKYNLYEILTSKIEWKIDPETITLDRIISDMEKDPELNNSSLSAEDKKGIAKAMVIVLSNTIYKFSKDNSYGQIIKAMGIENVDSGTFSINQEKKELTTNTEMEPNSVYKILKVENNKIHLHHIEKDVDLILIPANE